MSTTLAQYGELLLSRWRWIMWGILLALAVTTVFLILQPPLYRSEATVFVRTPGDVSQVQDGGDSYAQARASTYAALANSTSVSARVIADLGLDLKPEILSQRIQATHLPGTALIDIAVSAPSAAEAQRTATVLLSEYATTVRTLESVPGSLVPRAELVVVDPPGRPSAHRGLGCADPRCSARRNPDRAGSRFARGCASVDHQTLSARSHTNSRMIMMRNFKPKFRTARVSRANEGDK